MRSARWWSVLVPTLWLPACGGTPPSDADDYDAELHADSALPSPDTRSADAPLADALPSDVPRVDAPSDTPRADALSDAPRDAPSTDTGRSDAGRDASLDAATDAGRDGSITDAADASTDRPDAPPTDAGTPMDGGRTWEPVYFFTMPTGAFPDAGGPSVAVHVPPGYDPAAPLDVAVYFHGWSNCVANVVSATDGRCTPGGAVRNASHLIAQFDAARVHALLVVPELRVDAMTGDPGAFARPGGFRAFLQELFSVRLAPMVGRHDVADIRRLSVMSHSGGYVATAAVIAAGDLPALREVVLLDSLYASTATFDRWVQANLRGFVRPGSSGFRWVDVYTGTGGTDTLSRAMARRAAGWFATAGLSSSLLDDDTTATLPEASFTYPVIFKRSALSHTDVTRYYPRRLWPASGFAPLP